MSPEGNAKFDGRIIERGHRGIELRVQIHLSVQLVAVGIESAERAEENLALQSQRRASLNDLRNLLQLRADVRCWELCLKTAKA